MKKFFETTDDVQLNPHAGELVEFKFGDTELLLTLDAALDFQYRLVSLLCHIENGAEQIDLSPARLH